MVAIKSNNILMKNWKRYIIRMVKRRFGESVDTQKVSNYLDELAEKELKNPKGYFVNNYKRAVVATDLLAAFQSMKECDVISGGASTMYLQHGTIKNPFLNFILRMRHKRDDEKGMRKKYTRGERLWNHYHTKQNNTKIVTNSLYGVLGYAKFIFYNVFLAEAITRMGRVIIATASVGFENFLCDNVNIACESEVYEYMDNIIQEYEAKYSAYDFDIFGVGDLTDNDVIERIFQKCSFEITPELRRHVTAIVKRLPFGAKFMLYYKNNFMKFNRIPVIRDKIVYIVKHIPKLMLPELEKIEDEHIQRQVMDLWDFYEMAVFYNYPIFDNVRKMMYGTRKAVLYIDTDSNFISLARWVNQVRHEFLQDQYEQDEKDMIFVCSNILTIYLTTVVDRNLKMFARNCNIKEEWVKFLSMKNEFFFWRILFGDVKKRYIDLQLIQEGQILRDGQGLPEIKGYDFRKFSTKAPIRDYYTNMCTERILRPDVIDLKTIMVDIQKLKQELTRSMRAGESTYFKQANVSHPDHYADPFRISGIKGVLIWNAMAPDYPIDLPAEVDLIPIRNLATKKWGSWFAEHYPDEWARLQAEIFNNRNPAIAGIQCNIIAKPKNDDVPMPQWLLDIMDTNKILNSTVKLVNPIMDALGMKITKPTKNKEFLTNMVEL